MFASQIHKEREGGTVNRYTTVQRTLEAFDSTSPRRGSAAVILTEINSQFRTDGGEWLEREVRVCPE